MPRLNLVHIIIIVHHLASIPRPDVSSCGSKQGMMTRNGKRRGVDRHWLAVILFVLPGETGAAARRQRGSVAGLTFPFSCSQRVPARPIHPNRVLLFAWPSGLARTWTGGRRVGGGSSWGFGSAAGWMVLGAFKRGVRTTHTRPDGNMSAQATVQAEGG